MFYTDSLVIVDCLADRRKRLLGTPYNSKVFEMNIRENKGLDMGRATVEWEKCGGDSFKDKIYMASYTQGYIDKLIRSFGPLS